MSNKKVKSCDDNVYPLLCSDPICGVSPAERLTTNHLQLLRNAFTCPKAKTQFHENRSKKRGEKEEQGMRLEEFGETMMSVMGPDIEDEWVERFFSEVRRYNFVTLLIKKLKKKSE